MNRILFKSPSYSSIPFSVTGIPTDAVGAIPSSRHRIPPPVGIITARDNFIAKNGDSVLILPGQIPYSLISNYSIILISLLALSTATGTIATTPDTTLFGVAPAEGATATVANAMRSPAYNNALTGKEVTITLSPAYSSGRYAILRVEVSGNE